MLRSLYGEAQSGYTPRTETYRGRRHLVVPVVALVEGVVQAMNSVGPEFVSAAQFSKQPLGWNGRPVFHGHPMRNGRPVSGNIPDVLANESVGTIFNAGVKGTKLGMEAWLDEERCGTIAPELLARAKAGDPIEISVGAFVDTDPVPGEHNGKKYVASWKDITQDHLALLPADVTGACSREMGCGVRAAQVGMLEDLYSEDQARDEQGRFSGGAAAHGAAAKEHRAAARAHATAYKHTLAAMKTHDQQAAYRRTESRLKAQDATNKAHEKTNDANRKSNAMVPHGHSHGDRARDSSIAAHHAARNGDHHEASKHHEAAAGHHEALAHLIGKLGAVADKLRIHQGGDGVKNMYEDWLDEPDETLLRSLRSIDQATRDKMPKEDFAGPNESFPIQQVGDVSDAAQALGRAKGDRAAIKRRIVAIAYRKGADYVSALPDDWKRKTDQQHASRFARLMEAARSFFSLQSYDEMGDQHLRVKLSNALQDQEPNLTDIVSVYPIADPSHVVYTAWEPSAGEGGEDGMGYQLSHYERPFTISDAGVVTLGPARIEVKPTTSYEPAEGASPETLVGNGNNQYSHAEAAAHEAAAAAHDEAAKNPSETNSRKAFEASVAARKAAIDAGAKGVSRARVYNPKKGDASTPEQHKDSAESHRENAKFIREQISKQRNNEQEPVSGEPDVLEEPIKGEEVMKREEIMKALEKATDCQVKVISDLLEGKEPAKPAPTEAEIKAAADKQAADRKAEIDGAVAAAIKGLTFEQVLDKAPADIRSAVNAAGAVATEKKEATIKALKASGRCVFTDEDLKAMQQDQLDKLARLAEVKVANGVDFGGLGGPKQLDGEKPVDAPPVLGDAIRAARAAKQ